MVQILVRNLEDHLKVRLQMGARRNGLSMEAEAREILRNALGAEEAPRRGRTVDARDATIAGVVMASDAKLATRNEKQFEDISESVVNPWEMA